MPFKFKVGFNQYGTEPALFLTSRPTAPPSVYDGKTSQPFIYAYFYDQEN